MTTPYGGQAGGTFDQAGTTTESTTTARDKAAQVKNKIAEQARTRMEEAREKAGTAIDERKGELAGSMSSVAGAVRRSTDQLREEGHDRIAGYADSLAQQFDRAAGYLRERDGRQLREDLEGIARRQPALVIGAAFALGVLAARFLRSSDRETAIQRYEGNGGYGYTDYGTTGSPYDTAGSPPDAGMPPAGGGFNASDY